MWCFFQDVGDFVEYTALQTFRNNTADELPDQKGRRPKAEVQEALVGCNGLSTVFVVEDRRSIPINTGASLVVGEANKCTGEVCTCKCRCKLRPPLDKVILAEVVCADAS